MAIWTDGDLQGSPQALGLKPYSRTPVRTEARRQLWEPSDLEGLWTRKGLVVLVVENRREKKAVQAGNMSWLG